MNNQEAIMQYLKQKEIEIKEYKKLKYQEVTEEIDKIFMGKVLRYNANTKERLYVVCENSRAYEGFSEMCFEINVVSVYLHNGEIKTTHNKLPIFSIVSKYVEVDKQELKDFINQYTIDHIKKIGL